MKRKSHLDSGLLLRALGGELPAKKMREIEQHLLICSRCREQSEEIARTIDEYASTFGAIHQPEPPGGWAAFPAKLARLNSQQKSPSASRDLICRANTFLSGRFVLACQVAILTLGVIVFWQRLTRVQTVSASTLLDRATQKETTLLKAKQAGGVYQELQVQWGSQTFTRSTYRDFLKHTETQIGYRPAAHEFVECEEALARARLNWDELLSPPDFRAWVQEQPYPHSESVSQTKYSFLILSEIHGGPVREAGLVLRASDYHVIEERFEFFDGKQKKDGWHSGDTKHPTPFMCAELQAGNQEIRNISKQNADDNIDLKKADQTTTPLWGRNFSNVHGAQCR